jgi:4-diphosphocytidyl-2-C-methyl-D-erythritol kinase
LGARIGSDIAFFVYEAPFALGRGRGEKIKPISSLSNTRFWHILAVPKIHVSTPLIYRKYDQYSGLTASESSVKILLPALVKKDLPLVSEGIFNSLEAITIRLYPEVRRVKKTLADSGLKSILMSGSGPAVFAIASSKKEAVLLRNRLAKKYRSWRIFAVRTR